MDITITQRVRKRNRLYGVAINDGKILSKKSHDESCFKWWTNLGMKITNAMNRCTQLTIELGFSNLKLSWIQTGINLSNKASILSLMYIMKSMVIN